MANHDQVSTITAKPTEYLKRKQISPSTTNVKTSGVQHINKNIHQSQKLTIRKPLESSNVRPDKKPFDKWDWVDVHRAQMQEEQKLLDAEQKVEDAKSDILSKQMSAREAAFCILLHHLGSDIREVKNRFLTNTTQDSRYRDILKKMAEIWAEHNTISQFYCPSVQFGGCVQPKKNKENPNVHNYISWMKAGKTVAGCDCFHTPSNRLQGWKGCKHLVDVAAAVFQAIEKAYRTERVATQKAIAQEIQDKKAQIQQLKRETTTLQDRYNSYCDL